MFLLRYVCEEDLTTRRPEKKILLHLSGDALCTSFVSYADVDVCT